MPKDRSGGSETYRHLPPRAAKGNAGRLRIVRVQILPVV